MSASQPNVEQLAALNQEMAALVRAGIPLEQGLTQVAAAWPSQFSEVAQRIAERLSQGDSLPAALEREGPAISPAYVAVVEAGLAAGRLPEALEDLAEISLAMQDMRRRVWLSAIHPLLVCTLAYGLFVGFIQYGVPIWRDTRNAFYLPPRFLFSVLETLNATVRWWGPLIPLAILAVVSFSILRERLVHGGSAPGSWIPGAGFVRRHLMRAQFSRLLAVLIEHAVPAPRAVMLAADATGDFRLRQSAQAMSLDLQHGATWSEAISRALQLPLFLRWMLIVGGQQGSLPAVLRKTADTYQQKAERWLEWIRGTLPVLLVGGVCGSVVLMYSFAIFLPMLQFWQDLFVEG